MQLEFLVNGTLCRVCTVTRKVQHSLQRGGGIVWWDAQQTAVLEAAEAELASFRNAQANRKLAQNLRQSTKLW
jgi:hypothetical protein